MCIMILLYVILTFIGISFYPVGQLMIDYDCTILLFTATSTLIMISFIMIAGVIQAVLIIMLWVKYKVS